MDFHLKMKLSKTILAIFSFGIIDLVFGLSISVGLGGSDCGRNPGALCGIGAGIVGLMFTFFLFILFSVFMLLRFQKYRNNYSTKKS